MNNNIWSRVRIILILTIIIFFGFYLYTYVAKKCIEGFSKVRDVEFPFKNIKNQKGEKLGIIAISAPFREEKHEQLYQTYKSEGLAFLGISSYLNFPEKIYNPYEDRFHEKRKHDYLKMVSSWVYCTREPSLNMKNSNIPLLQLTEADMKDTTKGPAAPIASPRRWSRSTPPRPRRGETRCRWRGKSPRRRPTGT